MLATRLRPGFRAAIARSLWIDHPELIWIALGRSRWFDCSKSVNHNRLLWVDRVGLISINRPDLLSLLGLNGLIEIQ